MKEKIKRTDVKYIFDELSRPTHTRNDLAGWNNRLVTIFGNFNQWQGYYRAPFLRKWKFTKYIARQRLLDMIRNTAFTFDGNKKIPNLPMAPHNKEHHVNKNRPPAVSTASVEPILDPDGWPPILAWGSAKFGGRKGYRSAPNKTLAKYFARFTLVVMVPEMRTSIQCLCSNDVIRRTQPLTGQGRQCDHKMRPIMVERDDGGRRRVMCCLVKHDRRLKLLSDLPQEHEEYVPPPANQTRVYKCAAWADNAPARTFRTERHRVCPHVRF